MIKKCFNVAGFRTCGAYQTAKSAVQGLNTIFPSIYSVILHECATREEYQQWLEMNRSKFGTRFEHHATSPFVWVDHDGKPEYIGT